MQCGVTHERSEAKTESPLPKKEGESNRLPSSAFVHFGETRQDGR
jgi:hypothetical protein